MEKEKLINAIKEVLKQFEGDFYIEFPDEFCEDNE